MTLEQIIERARTATKEEAEALKIVGQASIFVGNALNALRVVEGKETADPQSALERALVNLHEARGKILTLMGKGPKCDRCASQRGLKTSGRSGAVLCEDCRQ